MTPKELTFWFQVLEDASKLAYERGHADGSSGKPLEGKEFKLSKAHKLLIKSEMSKYLKKA